MSSEPEPLIWVITTARRGDIVQCEAIARRLSSNIRFIEVNPRQPWAALMPWGPADPKDWETIKPPLPDLVIAANRRSYPYAKRLHKQTDGKARVLFMKPLGRDVSSFAHLWAPLHDHQTGDHVISTLTAPHLASQDILAECKANPDPRLCDLKGKKLLVLLGGNNKKVTYDEPAIKLFTDKLAEASSFDAVMVTASRRTPPSFVKAVQNTGQFEHRFVWDGSGDNPYFHMLAEADAILVSGDSHNMVGEALASGVPVHVVEPNGNPPKFCWTINELRARGLIQQQRAPLIPGKQESFDETPQIAALVQQIFEL